MTAMARDLGDFPIPRFPDLSRITGFPIRVDPREAAATLVLSVGLLFRIECLLLPFRFRAMTAMSRDLGDFPIPRCPDLHPSHQPSSAQFCGSKPWLSAAC
jgi:hypothetical protein